MSDRPDDEDTNENPSRRRFLGGMAALGAGVTLSGYVSAHEKPPLPADNERHHLAGPALDRALRENVKTVVVIYAENRSFNNLFGDFPGVQKPLSSVRPADYQQRDRDGKLLDKLPPAWGGVLQVGPQTVDGVTYPVGVQFQENLPNAPFPLKGPNAEDLPLSLVTRDLWHVFYQNQMQINDGRNDRFVA
ncbi:Acid phosphatase, partial [Pseudomonas coronafaciens pv. garcae]